LSKRGEGGEVNPHISPLKKKCGDRGRRHTAAHGERRENEERSGNKKKLGESSERESASKGFSPNKPNCHSKRKSNVRRRKAGTG